MVKPTKEGLLPADARQQSKEHHETIQGYIDSQKPPQNRRPVKQGETPSPHKFGKDNKKRLTAG
jgi:hypothetical protein